MFDVFYFDKKPNLFPHERKVDSLEQAQQLSHTRFFWIVNYLSDYDGVNFDFTWEPTPWESHQRHVWASQHQQDGGTHLVPKQGFTDTNYHREVIFRKPSQEIIYIDHGNPESPTVNYRKKVRYVDNYLDTLKRVAQAAESEYVWVCSSICDYKYFDFSWHSSAWQAEMLHVVASNEQIQGDTFYMHVASARQQLGKVEILDWYNLNYVANKSVPRLPMPQHTHDEDTHVDVIKNHEFTWPMELFTDDFFVMDVPTMSLWRNVYKAIIPMSRGASTVVVPREAQPSIKTQAYDYPFIMKDYSAGTDPILPIVFVSNGESCAEENWDHLKQVTKEYHQLRRIDNVKGRVASQRKAASIAGRPWYFFVPAKLRVSEDFKWNWQPDRLQAAKHYVFHAENPVTGLCYGHMAIVAYNQRLVLETSGTGIDFTLEKPHAIVATVSGTATYNADPQMAWRTAFREAVKLKHYLSQTADIETEYRLEMWLERSRGVNGHYSQLGAQAGVDYYNVCQGNLAKLQSTYEWEWVDQRWGEVSAHFNLKNV
jgi:hypothetical protein